MISRTEIILETQSAALTERLRRLGIKTVKICLHRRENERVDEIYMMLKPFLSFENFDWSIAEDDEGCESDLEVTYAEEDNGCI